MIMKKSLMFYVTLAWVKKRVKKISYEDEDVGKMT